MSNRAKDDINIDELSREELVDLLLTERKRYKRKRKVLKAELADVELALVIAAHDRDTAYRSLDEADNAIIVIMEKVLSDKGLALPSSAT